MNIFNPIRVTPRNVLIFVMLFFIVFNLHSIQKPFILDEVPFVKAANAVSNTGLPIIYEDGEAFVTGLWHPPLYIYLLALSFKIFGVSEVSARIVGIIFSLGTIILVYLLSMQIFKENKNQTNIALSGSLIYSINPFILQSSKLIDIDNTLLPFFITLFFLIYIKTQTMKNSTRLPILGTIFGILLWSKFATPVFMIISIFIFYILNKQYKKGLIDSVVITSIGGAFFILTWYLYCNITDLPFLAPFQHNIAYGDFSERGIFVILKALWGIIIISSWITPFFFLLAAIILLERTRNFLKFKKLMLIDLLLISGITIVVAYCIIRPLAYGFPKYFVSTIPLFSILIGELIVRMNIVNIVKEKYLQIISSFSIVVFYLLFAVKDPIMLPWKQESDVFIFIYHNYLISFLEFLVSKTILYILPLIIFIILIKYFKLCSKKSKNVILSLIFALISTSIYLDIIQSQSDYSTTYNYGETGLIETASYINKHTSINETIIANIDMAYYAERKFISPYEFLHSQSDPILQQRQIQEVIESSNINYLIFRSNDLWNKDLLELIESEYVFVSKKGSFIIYSTLKVN